MLKIKYLRIIRGGVMTFTAKSYYWPPCWPIAWLRSRLLKNSTGFWPIAENGRRFCSICISGPGGKGGGGGGNGCMLIWGLMLWWLKGGVWLGGPDDCMGKACCGCCPAVFCGTGGAVGATMGAADPGAGAEGPEVASSSVICSAPPSSWLPGLLQNIQRESD